MTTKSLRIPAAAILLLVAATTQIRAEAIQCANLIYGGTQTSRCFSDQFLTVMQQKTGVATERRFKSVRLGSEQLFNYPFVMITGEEDFTLTTREAENLEHYLCNGGFMVASAGCSSSKWDAAFRRNIQRVFGNDKQLEKIPLDHPLFRTVFVIESLQLSKTEGVAQLEGLTHNGRIVLIYSPHGLNDTAHTEGCCCCGGNEIQNALQVNVNALMYALMH